MTIRQKTLLIILSTYIGLIISLYSIFMLFIISGFDKLEELDLKIKYEQILDRLEMAKSSIRTDTADWGNWDEAYNYFYSNDPRFITNSLTLGVFSNTNLNLMAYINSKYEIKYLKMYDLKKKREIPVTENIKNILVKKVLIDSFKSNSDDYKEGLIDLDGKPYLLGFKRVRKTDGSSPTNGYLIMGKIFSRDFLESKRKNPEETLKVTNYQIHSKNLPVNIKNIVHSIDVTQHHSQDLLIQQESSIQNRGYFLLYDFWGKPIIISELQNNIQKYQESKESFVNLIVILTFIALGFCFITIVLIDKLILSRFKKLEYIVSNTNIAIDKIPEISITGKDEISKLVGSINIFFRELENYRNKEKKVIEDLEDLNARLQTANKHKTSFLASMSHEFRTPLNAIIGFSELLKQKLYGDLNDKQLEYINIILNSSSHLLDLVNDVLDITILSSSSYNINIEEFNPVVYTDEVINLMSTQFKQKSLKITKVYSADSLTVLADKQRFKQILLNLLSNAYKFTPKDGELTITIELTESAYAKISVADNGMGIDEKDFDKIFKEFFQSPSITEMALGGTGLGLALSKKLVERMGGQIGFISKINHGSTFWFTLPITT